jgi:hypothetical protein
MSLRFDLIVLTIDVDRVLVVLLVLASSLSSSLS